MPVAARLATSNPDYLPHMAQLDPSRMSVDMMTALRPFYFSSAVEPSAASQSDCTSLSRSSRVVATLARASSAVSNIAPARPPKAADSLFLRGSSDLLP